MTYWDDEAEVYREILFKEPSKVEMIGIFKDDLKKIIPEKLKELEERKKELLKEAEPYFKSLAGKDEFTRFYCREVYKVLHPEMQNTFKQIENFRWLKAMLSESKVKKEEINKEKIKSTPILSLYSFQKLRKVGGRWTALCPFHNEDTPSFVIYPDNSWWCFGCNKGGDSINFIQELRSCNFKEALQTIN